MSAELKRELINKVSDWDGFISRIIKIGMAPVIYKFIDIPGLQNSVPDKSSAQLRNIYFFNLSRNLQFLHVFEQIITTANTLEIKVVGLKGVVLLESLYKDSGLRQMSDIDVLIRQEDSKVFLQLLGDLGFKSHTTVQTYEAQNREIVHFEPMVKDGISIEVHVKLHRAIESYSLDHEEFLRNSIAISKGKQSYHTLHPLDNIIHICLHLDRHFNQGSIQFSGYLDLVNLTDNLNEEDWKQLILKCEHYHCTREFFSHILLIKKFMNANVPEYILQNFKFCYSITHEKRFLNYLTGKKEFVSGVPNHLSSIKLLPFTKKLRFVFEIIFPSKTFMIQKYGLAESEKVRKLESNKVRKLESRKSEEENEDTQNSKLRTPNFKLIFWWLWYPYRWWVGVKGVINSLRS